MTNKSFLQKKIKAFSSFLIISLTTLCSLSSAANPQPSSTINVNGSTTICDGESRTLSLPGVASNAKIQWYRNGRAVVGARSSSLNVNFGGTYSAVDTFAGEITQWGPVVINRVSKPVATISPAGVQNICNNGTLTLTASNGDTYLWSNGATSKSITVSTPGNYSVIIRNANGCSDTSEVVCVNPSPISSFNPNKTTLCEGNTVSFISAMNTPFCGTRSYIWTVEYQNGSCASSDFTYISGTNDKSLNPVIRFNKPGQYKVKLTNTWSNNSTCNSSTTEKIINVTSKAANTISISEVVCTSEPINITANPIACFESNSITYSWSFPGANISSANTLNPGTIFYSTPGTYTATLTQTSDCGTSITNKVIQVLQKPSLTNSSNVVICSSDNTNINLTSNANPSQTNYTWTVLADPSISGARNGSGNNIADVLYNNSTSPKTVVYTVTPVSTYANTVCTGTASQITVTVNPKPVVNSIPAITISSGTTITQALTEFNNYPNTIFNYTVSHSSAITGASNGNGSTINQTLVNTSAQVQSVIYTITANTTVNGSPCNSESRDFIVYVNPIPRVNIRDSLTICEEPNFTLMLSANTDPSNTTYTWTSNNVPSGVNNLIASGSTSMIPLNISIDDSTSTHKQITYFVTAHFTYNGHTSSGPAKRIDVFMMPEPSMIPQSDKLICSGDSIINNPQSNTIPLNTFYRWTADVPAGINGFTSGSGKNIYHRLINTTGEVKKIVYEITPFYLLNNVECNGETYYDTVTVNPKPKFQNLSNYVICNQSNLSIPLVTNTSLANPASTTFSYTVNPPAGVFGATSGTTNTITGILNNTNDVHKVVQYNVIATSTYQNLTCTSDTFKINVTINPKPVLTPLSTKIIASNTATNIALSANTNTTYTNYTWTVSSNANITGAAAGAIGGTNPVINQTLQNTSNELQYVVYSIRPMYQFSNNDCMGDVVLDTVYVLPNPSINAIAEQVICSGDSLKVNIGTNTNQNTSISWTVVGASNISGFANGTGNSIQQKLQNNSNAPETFTYRLIPTYTFRNQSVQGHPYDLQVTVNNVPQITSLQKPIICSGPLNYVSNSSSIPLNTFFSWSARSVRGTTNGLVNGSGRTIIANLINLSSLNDTIIYSITPLLNYKSVTCTGVTIEDTVIVLPLPQYTGKLKDTIKTAGTSNIILQNNIPSASTSYSWTFIANPNVSGASNGTGNTFTQTLTNNTTSPQTVNYNLTLNSNIATKNCSSNNYNLSVLVYPNAKAKFNTSSTISCAPFNLANAITPVPYPDAVQEYFWYANDVLIGTGSTFPGYIMDNPDDTVDIKLVTTSKYAAKSDSQITRFISPKRPAPVFTASTIEGCGPLTVNFSNNSPQFSGQTFRWNFGNGQSTTEYQPANAITFQPHPLGRDTVYKVILEGITACSTITYTVDVRVKSKADAIFSINKTVGCSPMNLEFINKSRGSNATYYWDFGNGETLTTTSMDTIKRTFISAKTDTFLVKLISQNSCGIDSMSYNVIVNPLSVNAQIVVDALQINGCAPHTVQIINSSTGSNLHTYNFGDLSSIYQSTKALDTIYHTYYLPGQYEIDFTAENECASKNQKIIINVYPRPYAIFSTTRNKYCEGDEVAFSNQTTGADTYFWDFGDGETSIQMNPTHRFYGSGMRTIRMIAYKNSTTGLICTDTVERVISIDPYLTPQFASSFDTVYCGTTNIIIPASSKGQFLTYWKTGDLYNPSDYYQLGSTFNHIYTKAGKYTITLYFETNNGCVDSISQNIYINDKPVAKLDADKMYICELGTVKFNNTSTYTGVYPIKYDYYINGNKISDSVNLTYYFNPTFSTDSFVYDVMMVAYDGIYCSDTIYKKVIVKKKSISSFAHHNSSNACIPYVLDLSNNSLYADYYEWYLDGQKISVDKNPKIILTEGNRNYNLKLITWNKALCEKDSTEMNITTFPEVISKVSTVDTLGCYGQLFVTFTNQSQNAVKHLWFFGDGSPVQTVANPSYFYTSPGIYTVMHVAESAFGCKDTSYTEVKVGKNVQAKYAPSSTFGCGTLTVDFQNLSTNYVRLKWDFDDNTISYDPNPQHTFVSRLEPYNVKLYAYNEVGCVDTFYFPTKILVGMPPVVEFDVDDSLKIIPEKTFSFTTLATYPVSFRKWDFGDGITSNEKNPTHEYRFTGKYFVTLTEIDTAGCEDIYSREVEVRDLEGNLWLPNAFTPKSGTDKIRTFTPIGYGIESYRIQIYNTAGQLLYESTSLDQNGRPDEGWDGTYNGEDMPQGSYIWNIEAKFLNGTTWKGMPDEEGKLKRTGLLFIVR